MVKKMSGLMNNLSLRTLRVRQSLLLSILLICIVFNGLCFSKELFDLKLGLFSIQDTKGEKTYTRFPEISANVGKVFKERIYAGLELDYFFAAGKLQFMGQYNKFKSTGIQDLYKLWLAQETR